MPKKPFVGPLIIFSKQQLTQAPYMSRFVFEAFWSALLILFKKSAKFLKVVLVGRLEMLSVTMLVGRDQRTWTPQEVFTRLTQIPLGLK